MIVLICGDRNWTDWKAIEDFIKPLPKDTTIIHGNCRGADKMAGYVAEKKYGLEVISFPANWEKYGRAAGPIRNKQMIVEGKPDLVVAFHNNILKSRGTKDMVTQARRHGIRVKIKKETFIKKVV